MAKELSWFDVIEESGKELAQRDEILRKQIVDRGPPIAIILVDKEYDIELRFWKIKGGVTEIRFTKGRPNVHMILNHTNEYVEALQKCITSKT